MPGKLGWVGLVAAILAGVLVGFAGSTLLYRYNVLTVPGEPIVKRMNRELRLTPTQREQIHQIIRHTHFEIHHLRHRLHREFRRQRHELFHQAYLQIRAVLTPQQRDQFERRFVPPSIRRGQPLPETPPSPAARASSAQSVPSATATP